MNTSSTAGRGKNTGRDSEQDAPESRFLVIGRITRPHGVRGEVRVAVHTDLPERFSWLEQVYVGEPPRLLPVERARFNGRWVILKLGGIDSREMAETLRRAWLQVPEEEAIPLEEGEFFLYQLVGLAVREQDGRELGHLKEVIETPANDVYVVDGPFGELLIPAVADVVVDVDLEAGVVTVALLPGILPDGA